MEVHDMALRDMFAIMASDSDIQQIINNQYDQHHPGKDLPLSRQDARYIHADKMMKARES